MSSLSQIRSLKGDRKNKQPANCRFCGSPSEVVVQIGVREPESNPRKTKKFLAMRSAVACEPCAVEWIEIFEERRSGA